jgi:hypothetical protein
VITKTADAWIAKNINLTTSLVRSARSKRKSGFLNLKEFARRHGKPGSAQSWVKCGLPITEYGVPVNAGDIWVAKHMATNGKASNKAEVADDGSMNRTAFARMARIGLSRVAIWVRRGMPTTANGRIMPEAAKGWASRALVDAQIYPFWLDNPNQYEQRKQFAERVGIYQNLVKKLCDRGLPCASNGWVHIQRGLEWVRDNTDIKIPASAWPKKTARSKTKQRNSEEQRLAA